MTDAYLKEAFDSLSPTDAQAERMLRRLQAKPKPTRHTAWRPAAAFAAFVLVLTPVLGVLQAPKAGVGAFGFSGGVTVQAAAFGEELSPLLSLLARLDGMAITLTEQTNQLMFTYETQTVSHNVILNMAELFSPDSGAETRFVMYTAAPSVSLEGGETLSWTASGTRVDYTLRAADGTETLRGGFNTDDPALQLLKAQLFSQSGFLHFTVLDVLEAKGCIVEPGEPSLFGRRHIQAIDGVEERYAYLRITPITK